jgi:hypothetical protein
MTQALQRREDISLLPTTDTLKSMFDMSDALYKSGLLPNHIKSPQAAFAVIQKGLELGIPPMYSMSNIIVIQGKPTANAELMLALIYRDHGDNAIQFSESSSTKCTVLYRRKAWASPLSHSFTIEEAKTAGLLSNQTWQKYPKAMLRARCISAVARLAFPDSIGGMYTPEELGAQVSVSDDDEVLIVEDTQPTAKLLTMPSQPSQETTTRDSQRAAEDCERVGREPIEQISAESIREFAKTKGIDIDAKLAFQKKPSLEGMTQDSLQKIQAWIEQVPQVQPTEPQQAIQRDWYKEIELIWASIWRANLEGFKSKSDCFNHLVTTALSYKWIDSASEIEGHTDLSSDQAEKYYSICCDLYAAAKEQAANPLY